MSDYLQKRYEEFRDIGRDMFVSGLVSSHGGNLSAREGARIFITRTGSQLGRLRETDIVAVPFEAAGAEADAGASVELVVHRALYHDVKGVGGVAHAHAPYTVLASLDLAVEELVPLDSEAKFFMPRVPIITATETIGSTEVAELLPAVLAASDVPIAVLRGHGPFAIGATIEDAYRWISVLEMSARLLVGCQ